VASPTRSQNKPGRTLLVLLAIILAMGGVLALQKAFAPQFGLDLAGGTTVTLSPVTTTGKAPTQESLDLAVNIIRDRVNGNGISDAEVAKSGDNIVISVPGKGQEEVLALLGTTAELRFRQVLAVAAAKAAPASVPTAAPTPTTSGGSAPSATPSATGSGAASGASAPAKASAAPSGTPAGRALSSALTAPSATPTPSATASAASTDKGAGKTQATPSASAPATPPATASDDPLAGADTSGIDPPLLNQFRKIDCTSRNRGQGAQDDPNKQIVACSKDGGARYILDKAAVRGTEVSGASAGVDQTTGEWVVSVDFKSQGANQFAKITGQITTAPEPRNQLAMVLDGLVISSPVIQEPIPGGRARISGSFNQQSSNALADQLKYGALPLKFLRSSVEEVSSTLGADQLKGGLLAGGLGLAIVLIYSLLYYRGLGLVSVSSLLVASILTFFSVDLLSENAGFRLSLPHIIGLIVSIGITADSFIIYFERIRDELRAGKTLRLAVEVAWRRARRTIIVADAVTFIAAVVLYFLAVGGVAGFAFAMGLTTLIDIAVVFMFTKPLVALLARLKFFAKGHKLSGLDAERMHHTTPGVRSTPQEA
jgi:preprotein translocase subunit SecD